MKAFPDFPSEYRNTLKELYIDYQSTLNFAHCTADNWPFGSKHGTDYQNRQLDEAVRIASHAQQDRGIRCDIWRRYYYAIIDAMKARLRLNMRDNRIERRYKRPKQTLLAEAVAIYLKQPRLDILDFIFSMGGHTKALRIKLPEIALVTEQHRRFDKDWRAVPWDNEPWYQASPWYSSHGAHFSVKQAGMLAYNESVDKLKRDIQTQISPGRYLNRFFPHVLDQTQIKYWAEKFAARADTSFELKILNNDTFEGSEGALMDAWVKLYRVVKVDYSCMRGEDCVRVYGKKGNHLGLAYLENKEGEQFCRSIVRFDTMRFVRCYPSTDRDAPVNENMMARLLEEAGFLHGDLDGIEVLYIDADESGCVVMPYLDGGMGIEEGCGCVRLSKHGLDASNTDGTARLNEGTQCDRCGDLTDEDDLIYIESEEIHVCGHCCDNHYTLAMGRYDYEYFPNDDVVEVNGTYYAERHLSRHGIVECCNCGEYVHTDDSYLTPDGEACQACVTCLDEEYQDCGYALTEDVVELSDGRNVHKDVADELQAEIDAEEEEEKVPLLVDHTPPEANHDMFAVAG